MDDKERRDIIKGLMEKATVENPQFQQALRQGIEEMKKCNKPVERKESWVERYSKLNVGGNPITFFELSTLVLLVLKLTGTADISWLLVWCPLAIEIFLTIAMVGFVLLEMYMEHKREKKN